MPMTLLPLPTSLGDFVLRSVLGFDVRFFLFPARIRVQVLVDAPDVIAFADLARSCADLARCCCWFGLRIRRQIFYFLLGSASDFFSSLAVRGAVSALDVVVFVVVVLGPDRGRESEENPEAGRENAQHLCCLSHCKQPPLLGPRYRGCFSPRFLPLQGLCRGPRPQKRKPRFGGILCSLLLLTDWQDSDEEWPIPARLGGGAPSRSAERPTKRA